MGRIDFECESLINGKPNACSYFNCGIVHLTEEEGQERAKFALDYGMLPYQLRWVYVTSSLTTDEITQAIRAHMHQDQIWHFNEHGGTVQYTDLGKDWIMKKFSIDVSSLTAMSEEEMDALYGKPKSEALTMDTQ